MGVPVTGPEGAGFFAAQLVLVDQGDPIHHYPRLIDLGALFSVKGSDELVIGRGGACDITLAGEVQPPPGQHYEPAIPSISRQHCRLRRSRLPSGEYTLSLMDGKSVNGTFLNWHKIDSTGAPLKAMDYICFGGGSRIPVGGKLDKSPAPGVPTPVSYVLHLSTTPQDKGRIKFGPDTHEQYSQVSVRSFTGQMEALQAEEEQAGGAGGGGLGAAEAPAPSSVLAPCSGNPFDNSIFSEELAAVPPTADLPEEGGEAAASPAKAPPPAAPPQEASPAASKASPGGRQADRRVPDTRSPGSAGGTGESASLQASPPALQLRSAALATAEQTMMPAPPSRITLGIAARKPDAAAAAAAPATPVPGSQSSSQKGKRPKRRLLAHTEEEGSMISAALQNHAALAKARGSEGVPQPPQAAGPLVSPSPHQASVQKSPAAGVVAGGGGGGGGVGGSSQQASADSRPLLTPVEFHDFNLGIDRSELEEELEGQEEEVAGAAAALDVVAAAAAAAAAARAPPCPAGGAAGRGGGVGGAAAAAASPRRDAKRKSGEASPATPQSKRKAVASPAGAVPSGAAAAAANLKRKRAEDAGEGVRQESAAAAAAPPAAEGVGVSASKDSAKPKRKAAQRKPRSASSKAAPAKARGLTGARAARAQANGLPSFRSGFDMMCAERLEAAREAGQAKSGKGERLALVKAWRNLDVARKQAYEERAAEEKEALLQQHPELALLNPNQEDEETRLLAFAGQAAKPAKQENVRARMRAARAKLFDDLDDREEQTRTLLCDAEQQGRTADLEAQSPGGEGSLPGDAFQIDNSCLAATATRVASGVARSATAADKTGRLPPGAAPNPLASSAATALSERLLGTTGSHTLVLPKSLAELLKHHQIQGIRFLWKNLVTVPALMQQQEAGAAKPVAGGCIIAHGMGLGKTLTTIAFVLMWNRVGKGSRTLIVAPKSTLRQWEKEFEDWCEASRHECPPVYIVEGVKHADRARKWGSDGGVLLLSYAMLVRFIGLKAGSHGASSPRPASPSGDTAAAPASSTTPAAGAKEKRRKASNGKAGAQEKDGAYEEDHQEVQRIMQASQYVDDDEEAEQLEVEKAAKEAKKEDPATTALLAEVGGILKPKTDLLVIDEGHKISSPNSALTKNLAQVETLNRVVLTGTPMQNNLRQYHTMIDFVRPDSWDFSELSDLYNRANNDPTARVELVHGMKGFIQRYDCSLLREELPPLTEYVIYTKPSALQKLIYSQLMTASGGDASAKVKASKALSLGSIFLKLCAHTNLAKEYCKTKGVKSLEEQIASAVPPNEEDDTFAISHDLREQLRRGKVLYDEQGKDFSWAAPLFRDDYIARVDSNQAIDDNPKLQVLLAMIQKATELGEKMAVFSESTALLDVLELCLPQVEPPKQRSYTGAKKRRTARAQWRRGTEYHRLDGTSSAAKRAAMCEDFNLAGSRSSLILVSTRSGGLGINLIGATRVVLYGVGWNAQSELQAIYRTYRYGQLRPVTVYRLIIQGTIEQTIFARTVAKLRMSMNFIDGKWSRADLKSFDSIPPTDWSFHASKDAVLQSVYDGHSSRVHSVLLHDSLKVSLDVVEEEQSDAGSEGSEGIDVIIASDSEGGDEDIIGITEDVSPPLLGTPPTRAPVLPPAARAASLDFGMDDDSEGHSLNLQPLPGLVSARRGGGSGGAAAATSGRVIKRTSAAPPPAPQSDEGSGVDFCFSHSDDDA